MSDHPDSTKQKFFGTRGLELRDAAQALARELPLEVDPVLSEDPAFEPDGYVDGGFVLNYSTWTALEVFIDTQQAAFGTLVEKLASIEAASGAVVREVAQIKFWPEH